LAKTIYAIWQADELRGFTADFDELKQLAKWGDANGTENISEVSLAQNSYKIQELLALCTEVFEKYATTAEEVKAESVQTPSAAATSGTATVPMSISGSKPTSTDAETNADQDQPPTQEEQDGLDRRVATEVAFVASAAYGNLINQFLEKNSIAQTELPLELQAQLKQLGLTLRNRLWEMIDKLPAEKKSQLLEHNLRIYLYQKLLIELMRDPQFYPMLNQFYRSYVRLVVEKQGLAAATAVVAQIDQYFNALEAIEEIEADEINPVLERIRTEIRVWKEAFLAELAEEAAKAQLEEEPQPEPAKIEEQTIFDQQPETLTSATPEPEAITEKLPPPKINFEPNQQAQLQSHLRTMATNLTDRQQTTLSNQSARVLWGTLAELFTDNSTELASLPPELHNAVFAQTLSYLMTLGPIELEQLRTSPSSLIRHIKNNAQRILSEANFQRLFQQYTKTKLIEAISRVDRVEKETNWTYQRVYFELFSAHNITDETVPDEAGLQDVFDDVKQYLRESLFVYIEELPTNDLLGLYMKSKDREQFLEQIYQFLNTDRQFIHSLSQLYTNLLNHYEKTEQFGERTQLQTSLNRLVKIDGAVFRIKANAPAPEALLSNSLSNTLKTDSKVLLDLTDTTLRAMVLSLGLQSTLDLIHGNNPELLGLVFNLPKGMLREDNIEDFRSILMEYAKVKAVSLQTSAYLPENGLVGATVKPKRPSSAAAEQLEFVRAVQVVVQSQGKDGDEVVAAATNAKTIKEKRDIVMKIFGSEWQTLSQQDQMAVYVYYSLPFNEEQLKHDINTQLSFPFEFIDFRAKKDYRRLIEELSNEYELHGVKNFNPLFKASYLEDKTPAEKDMREINRLLLALQAYNFAQLTASEKLLIAQQAGFTTAEEFLNIQLKGAQDILESDPLIYQYAQSLPIIDRLSPQSFATAEAAEPNFFQRALGTQPLSPKQQLLSTFKQLGGQKLKSEGLKKGAAMLAAKAGLGAATGGLATVAGLALSVVGNKRVREIFIGGITALVASLMYSLSTIGGLLGALIGGAAGFLGGPLGLLGGGLAGTYAGAAVFPQQWGGWMGFSPRQAPGIGSWFSSEQPIDPSQSSISAMRAANAQAASPVNASLAANSGLLPQGAAGPLNVGLQTPSPLNVGLGSGGAGTAASTAAGAGTTAATGSSGGIFGNFLGMPIGVATPLIGVFSTVILTLTTILVIAGAFIVPLPTRNAPSLLEASKDGLQPGAKFVEIEKTASINQIENNTKTTVTYTVTITPKGNYRILVNDLEDIFSVYGDQVPDPLPTSEFSGSYFPELIDKPTTATYEVELGENTTDAIVANNLIVNFDVINRNDYPEASDQTYRTTESVRVGNPKIACWPSSGTIRQLPLNKFSHPKASAFDIGAVEGVKIFATFPGTAERIDTPTMPGGDGYGISVKITTIINGIPAALIFGHMYSSTIRQGETKQVEVGELIGLVDDSGYRYGTDGEKIITSFGNHLHYEVKTNPPYLLKIEDLVPDGVGAIRRFNNNDPNDDQVYDCYQQ